MPYYNPGQYYNQMQMPMPMQDQLAQLRANQFQPQMAPTNSIIWVQGEAGARAFLVANGNTVDLWDSEAPIIYLKSVDNSGVPSMRVLDYTERSLAPRTPPAAFSTQGNEYIRRDEFEATVSRLEGIMGNSAQATVKKQQKGDKKDDE